MSFSLDRFLEAHRFVRDSFTGSFLAISILAMVCGTLTLQFSSCVFRPIVTDHFGSVTADFGVVTGHFGIVTEAIQ